MGINIAQHSFMAGARLLVLLGVTLLVRSSPLEASEATQRGFSALNYVLELKLAIIEGDNEKIKLLSGGESAPQAPTWRFLNEKPSTINQGKTGMRHFLTSHETVIIVQETIDDKHSVFFAYVRADRLRHPHLASLTDLSDLAPYNDYFACEIEVDEYGMARMPSEFCFSETGALWGP